MKPRDIVLIVVSVVMFAVAGYVAYSQLAPQSSSGSKTAAVKVEIVTPIPQEFNQDALSQLTDSQKTKDFSVQFDLKTGLNNSQPFGSL